MDKYSEGGRCGQRACVGGRGCESGEAEDKETGRVCPIFFLNHKKERAGVYSMFPEFSCDRTGETGLLCTRSKHHILRGCFLETETSYDEIEKNLGERTCV